MTHAYVTANAAALLTATTAFYETSYFVTPAERPYLIDGRMDKQVTFQPDTATTILVDFGAAVSLTGWGILNHNLSDIGGGTILIRAATDSAISTSVVTAKAVTTINPTAPRHRDVVLQFSAVSKRYWSIEVTQNVLSSLKIGELFPYVSATQLTRGYTDGSAEPEEIITVGAQMQFGEQREVFMAGPLRHKRMRFQDYTSANNAELMTMWRATRGPLDPLLWIESYEAVATAAANAQQDCIYGKLQLNSYEAPFTDFDLVQPPELIIRQKGRGVGL